LQQRRGGGEDNNNNNNPTKPNPKKNKEKIEKLSSTCEQAFLN
jgi:hypothetical protein